MTTPSVQEGLGVLLLSFGIGFLFCLLSFIITNQPIGNFSKTLMLLSGITDCIFGALLLILTHQRKVTMLNKANPTNELNEKQIKSDFALAQKIYDKIVGKNENLMPSGDRKMLFALCLIYVRQLKHHRYEEKSKERG